jgi:hypothetical protein
MGWMRCVAALAMAATAACGDDTSSATGAGNAGGGSQTGSSQAGGGGQAGSGVDVDALYACEETNLQVPRPLSGPSFDAEQGGFLSEPTQTTYVVHTTQIYVPAEKQSAFNQLFGPIVGQLGATEGLVAWTVAYDETCGVNRTLGVWESEAAMYEFVATGAHATAMSQTTEVSLSGRVTHWEATVDEVEQLEWSVARAKLEQVEPSPIYD